MIWLHNAALRPIASSGHRLAFEEANPSMLLPLVTITTFDVILMLRESAMGWRDTVSTSRICSVPDDRSPASRFPEGARTDGSAAGATNLGDPRVTE